MISFIIFKVCRQASMIVLKETKLLWLLHKLRVIEAYYEVE